MLYSSLDAGPRIAQRPKFMNLSFEYSRKTDQRARQPSSDSAAVLEFVPPARPLGCQLDVRRRTNSAPQREKERDPQYAA
jgi:hypothetical protein